MFKLKICGLKRAEDIAAINAAKPDYCGFVINYPKSSRNVDVELLTELSRQVHPDVKKVGVFVNEEPHLVADLLLSKIIDVAQLHGTETDEYIQELKELAPDKEIWQAFVITDPKDLQKALESQADCILLDSGRGSGRTFDWKILQNFPRPYFLAGGLTCEKMIKASQELHPFGMDISGGVETDSLKDPKKIAEATKISKTL